MANKLFIVCPFSCMEAFLRNVYGDDVLFLTFSGAVFQFKDVEYSLEVKEVILRENVKNIYIVNDVACRFINGIVMRNNISEFPSVHTIEALYIDSYFLTFKNQPVNKQKYMLAELNVIYQINEMINSSILGSCISEMNIDVKGVITSKEKKIYKLLQI